MGNVKSILMAATGVAVGVAVGMVIYEKMLKKAFKVGEGA
jgi:uncharacterized protein YebE (UPF0316 family)